MCVLVSESRVLKPVGVNIHSLDHILKGCCENVTAGFKLC